MIRVEIETETPAFAGKIFIETARILSEVADDLSSPACTLYVDTSYELRDSNGEIVGKVTIVEQP